MFQFLKDKLKGALKKFSKEVEEEAVEEVVEEKPAETPKKEAQKREKSIEPEKKPVIDKKEDDQEKNAAPPAKEEPKEEKPAQAPKENKTLIGKLFKKKESGKEPAEDQPPTSSQQETTTKEEATQPPEQPKSASQEPEEKQEKEGFFTKLTKITLSEEKFESMFWDIEITLLENNVAVEVIERIKQDLKEALTGEKMSRKSVEDIIKSTLKKTIRDILSAQPINLLKKAEEKKPLVIAMIGVNGSGKTTTLAKLAKYFQDRDKTVVVAAADTFRAAAIQQLEEHTTKLGVKLIKHDYGGDPAAVAYDAVKHATAKGIDVVLIDSAGRLHSNDNLMNELKKLVRVNKPDLNLFVGEAITGNDCVEQAKLFDEAVGIDGIILAKADVDEKGGAAISASFITKKPILFLGTGQRYEDLKEFKTEDVITSLGL